MISTMYNKERYMLVRGIPDIELPPMTTTSDLADRFFPVIVIHDAQGWWTSRTQPEYSVFSTRSSSTRRDSLSGSFDTILLI
jgi:hypothetical protein